MLGSQENPFKPLVVGAPRSGFTLLISILNHLTPLMPAEKNLKQDVLNIFIKDLDFYISQQITNVFKEHGHEENLIFNGNFQELLGGPKWLKPENPQLACFRKYLGVKGLGDFTLNISHPREVFDFYKVVHSHSAPALWLEEPYYENYTKFASVRNPIGILNSSVFSINALTSEYIQKFRNDDNDEMRQHLAKYKLTNLEFFEGLVQFQKGYWTEFLKVKDQYLITKWEDIIENPIETIQSVGRQAGLSVSPSRAKGIWEQIGFKNLTGHHKHNFRSGKGKVGDWKNWLLNEHLEIIRKHGLEEVLVSLGYDKIEDLDESQYTPFQKELKNLIDAGQIFEDYPDQDLFIFAFNKSNLNSEKFPFKRYGWREHTQVERSVFKDQELETKVWDVAEESTARVNRFFLEIINGHWEQPEMALKQLKSLYSELFNSETSAFKTAQTLIADSKRPPAINYVRGKARALYHHTSRLFQRV